MKRATTAEDLCLAQKMKSDVECFQIYHETQRNCEQEAKQIKAQKEQKKREKDKLSAWVKCQMECVKSEGTCTIIGGKGCKEQKNQCDDLCNLIRK